MRTLRQLHCHLLRRHSPRSHHKGLLLDLREACCVVLEQRCDGGAHVVADPGLDDLGAGALESLHEVARLGLCEVRAAAAGCSLVDELRGTR